MKLPELLEQRAVKIAEMRSLQTTADKASRDLSGEERTRFDALETEVNGLDSQIKRAKTLDNLERSAEATPLNVGTRDFQTEASRYSLTRALAHASGLRVDAGRELEVSQEIENRSGRKAQGIFAPDSVFRVQRNPNMEQRVVTSAGDGAGLVFRDCFCDGICG